MKTDIFVGQDSKAFKLRDTGGTVELKTEVTYVPSSDNSLVNKKYLEDTLKQFLQDKKITLEADVTISLNIPTPVFINDTVNIVITNYDSNSTYTVSAELGNATINGDTITYTAPNSKDVETLTITRDNVKRVVKFDIEVATVVKPSIVSPTDGQVNVAFKPQLISTPFAYKGSTQNHVASQWQISENKFFTKVVEDSGETSTALTSYTSNTSLNSLTTYWVRVRHKGDITGWSEWSDSVMFTTTNLPSWLLTYNGTGSSSSTQEQVLKILVVNENGTNYIYTANRLYGNYTVYIKFTSDGNVVWSKTIGYSGNYSVIKDFIHSNENGINYFYAIAESLIYKFDTNGNVVWSKYLSSMWPVYYGFLSVVNDNGSHYLHALIVKNHDMYHVKFNASDGTLISNNIVANPYSYFYSYFAETVMENGNVYHYITGYGGLYDSSFFSYVAKLNEDGTPVWSYKGIAENEYFRAAKRVIENGNIYLYAIMERTPTAQKLFKFDKDGNIVLVKDITFNDNFTAKDIEHYKINGNYGIFINGNYRNSRIYSHFGNATLKFDSDLNYINSFQVYVGGTNNTVGAADIVSIKENDNTVGVIVGGNIKTYLYGYEALVFKLPLDFYVYLNGLAVKGSNLVFGNISGITVQNYTGSVFTSFSLPTQTVSLWSEIDANLSVSNVNINTDFIPYI